jgi:hypothetical protein
MFSTELKDRWRHNEIYNKYIPPLEVQASLGIIYEGINYREGDYTISTFRIKIYQNLKKRRNHEIKHE